MGGRGSRNPNNDDDGDIAAIQYALKKGIKHIDTAESYADGKAEELVGKAIADFDRNDLFIATKAYGTHLGYDNVLNSCEQSLKRLGIDCIDLYYIHKPNPEIPIAETARAFNRLLENNMIKHIGISNASVETMEEYKKHLAAPILAAQNHYNLIVRQSEVHGVLDYCKKNNIHYIAWRPIQLPVPSMGIESLAKRGVYPLLDEIADKYGKTNAQIAVRWLTLQENVGTIFKSKNPRHIEEIIETNDFEISAEDMKRLTDDFPRQESEAFISTGYVKLV